jgi:hypothetical protein
MAFIITASRGDSTSMNRRVSTLLVVVFVLLAGCAGGAGPGDASTTTGEQTTDGTAATTATATATPTPEPTATAEWSSPTPPNSPTQVAEKQVERGRIESVSFTDTTPGANGEGYANFDLRVRANTTMENVDPEHGTVDGEPYFVVLVEDRLVERTKLVLEQEDGEYDIQVRGGALTNFDPGTLEVTVLLMDEDTQRDDVFGRWTGEIEYNPN